MAMVTRLLLLRASLGHILVLLALLNLAVL